MQQIIDKHRIAQCIKVICSAMEHAGFNSIEGMAAMICLQRHLESQGVRVEQLDTGDIH